MKIGVESDLLVEETQWLHLDLVFTVEQRSLSSHPVARESFNVTEVCEKPMVKYRNRGDVFI